MIELPAGGAFGVGSLPHRSAADAAAFSLREFDLATIPTLPRRSPAESMIAQAVVGVTGVTLGQYGSICVDAARFDADAPVVTDLDHDAFVGWRTFLDVARSRGLSGPVKWQFVGPVTLGVALTRAGAAPSMAFDVAVRVVRAHLAALSAAVAEALPDCQQIAVVDEPWMGELMSPGFPIPPDAGIDLLSGALAALESTAIVGVHCCAAADWASLLAAGPRLLSLPVTPDVVGVAGYLARFFDDGGYVAWGAVPTSGPVPASAERSWRALSDLWCQLVQHGCEPGRLRRQSLVTPQCGLGLHSPAVAERVCRLTREVGRRIHDQASATRFVLGA